MPLGFVSGGPGCGRFRELFHSHQQTPGSDPSSVLLRSQEHQARPSRVGAFPRAFLLRGQLPPHCNPHHTGGVSMRDSSPITCCFQRIPETTLKSSHLKIKNYQTDTFLFHFWPSVKPQFGSSLGLVVSDGIIILFTSISWLEGGLWIVQIRVNVERQLNGGRQSSPGFVTLSWPQQSQNVQRYFLPLRHKILKHL